MTQSLAGDHPLLRRVNHAAVIRLVWKYPGISRSELAARIGITKSGMSLLVQELLDEGWLQDGVSSAAINPGRPSIPLFVDKDRFALIGVEIDVRRLNAVCIDPYGSKIGSLYEDGDFRPLQATLERVADLVRRLKTRAEQAGRTVLGVGVGVPGPVDLAHGLVKTAPNLGWNNISLHQLLADALPEVSADRIFVDNDANLSAMAEYLFANDRRSSDLLYIRLAYGIGGGVLHDHKLTRGRHGFAGEIGHMTILPNGPKCSCGNAGCAEMLCSFRGIQHALARETGETLEMPQVQERLDRGDEATLRVVRRAGTYLGIFAANLVNALDPEVVIVGGLGAALGDALLEPARREMTRRVFGRAHRTVPLLRSEFGLDDCALGAAGFVWHNLLQGVGLD